MTFYVRAACGGSMLHHVKISVVSADGHITVLGETGAYGAFSVDRQRLLGLQARVFLFCRESYECGALSAETQDFYGYGEHYVQLAPAALR